MENVSTHELGQEGPDGRTETHNRIAKSLRSHRRGHRCKWVCSDLYSVLRTNFEVASLPCIVIYVPRYTTEATEYIHVDMYQPRPHAQLPLPNCHPAISTLPSVQPLGMSIIASSLCIRTLYLSHNSTPYHSLTSQTPTLSPPPQYSSTTSAARPAPLPLPLVLPPARAPAPTQQSDLLLHMKPQNLMRTQALASAHEPSR